MHITIIFYKAIVEVTVLLCYLYFEWLCKNNSIILLVNFTSYELEVVIPRPAVNNKI